jgi:hypothetical protein
MAKSTEVLEELDSRSSVELQSSSEAKAEGAGHLTGDSERPSPPAENSSSAPQQPVELQSTAGLASLVGPATHSTVQQLPMLRRTLSKKIFDFLPEELIPWLGVILPLFVLIVGYLFYFNEFGLNPVPTVWHALVVGIVPVANLLVWTRMRNRSLSTPAWRVHQISLICGASYGDRHEPLLAIVKCVEQGLKT